MSRSTRRAAGRRGESELQAIERALRKKDSSQADALARLDRMRSDVVRDVQALASDLAVHVAAADIILEEAETSSGWHFTRTGMTTDLDEAERHIAASFVIEQRTRGLVARIAELDAIRAHSHGPDRAGADGATMQMLMQIRAGAVGDPVARLVTLGHLSAEDLRDTQELERIWRYVSQGRGAAMMNFAVKPELSADDVAVDRSDDDFMGLLHAFVYHPWWRDGGAASRLTFRLAVEGVSLDQLRHEHRIGFGTAVQWVRQSLEGYRKIRREGLRAA